MSGSDVLVTCGCGFEVRGTVDDCIAAVKAHDQGCEVAQEAERQREEWRRVHGFTEPVIDRG